MAAGKVINILPKSDALFHPPASPVLIITMVIFVTLSAWPAGCIAIIYNWMVQKLWFDSEHPQKTPMNNQRLKCPTLGHVPSFVPTSKTEFWERLKLHLCHIDHVPHFTAQCKRNNWLREKLNSPVASLQTCQSLCCVLIDLNVKDVSVNTVRPKTPLTSTVNPSYLRWTT